jgi:hypothetical protein
LPAAVADTNARAATNHPERHLGQTGTTVMGATPTVSVDRDVIGQPEQHPAGKDGESVRLKGAEPAVCRSRPSRAFYGLVHETLTGINRYR